MSVIILDSDNMPEFVKTLAVEVREIIKEEVKTKEPYLETKELVEKFGYSTTWWRKQIDSGKVGKRVFNGDYKAQYSDAHKFLFGTKQ